MLASNVFNHGSEQDTVKHLDTVRVSGDIKTDEHDTAAAPHPALCIETSNEIGINDDDLASGAFRSNSERPTFANLDTVRGSGNIQSEKGENAGNFIGAHPLGCTEPGCGKHFGRLDHLKRHMLIHTGQKIKCSYLSCNRLFREKYELRLHTQSFHEQAEPYVCSVEGCDQKFNTTTGRKRHQMKSHAKISHQCPVCSRNFIQKHLLDGHMTLHTGLKKYACKDCQKEFSYKHNLATHIKNKSCSIKPSDAKVAHFFCDHVGCGKGYADKRCLKRHIDAAHTSTVFKCDKCQQIFSYGSSLSRHKHICN
eukprot:Seg7899.2 transcript_id=Seg7899.2/GoldUCD/mRNA.D3Y31 product="Zinc finger protein 13" protein_id=Seg7899.2/GoldUCD/D3Y31